MSSSSRGQSCRLGAHPWRASWLGDPVAAAVPAGVAAEGMFGRKGKRRPVLGLPAPAAALRSHLGVEGAAVG